MRGRPRKKEKTLIDLPRLFYCARPIFLHDPQNLVFQPSHLTLLLCTDVVMVVLMTWRRIERVNRTNK